MLVSCLACSSTLQMEKTCSSKMSVVFQQTTRFGVTAYCIYPVFYNFCMKYMGGKINQFLPFSADLQPTTVDCFIFTINIMH
jgi:hypothetical protein